MSIYKMGKIILALLLAGSLSTVAWATDENDITTYDTKTRENITEKETVNSGENNSYVKCTFSGLLVSGDKGGAITNNGTIEEISDCTFTNNQVTMTSTSNGWGGAIYNNGTITKIYNTVFTENNAGMLGGAIFNDSNSYIYDISDCTFTNNTSGSVGGAICNRGYMGVDANGNVTGGISNSVFYGNTTSSCAGAIYNNYGGKIGDIESCYFVENTGGKGGAIFNDNQNCTIASISGCYFVKNEATSDAGGAIYNEQTGTIGDISGCYFYENTAANNGGAIYNHSGSEINDIKGSYFVGNVATNGEGGAIYNDQSVKVGDIENCYFEGNKATGSTDGTGRGGAIYNDENADIGIIKGSYFIENTAELYAGAIYNNEDGTIDSIESCVFLNNEAQAGNGGAIENGWGTSVIGSITGSYFERNIAKKNESEATAGTTGLGAAIYNEGTIGTVEEDGSITGGISDSQFINNTADVSGGAIYNRYNAEKDTHAVIGDITNCYFDGNAATSGSGGAIYNAVGCTIGTITNSSFVNNTAGEKGGAIYTTSDLTIAADGSKDGGSVVFKGNSATNGGDAIYMAKDESGDATTLSFSLSNGGSIALYDSVSGEDEYSVNISGDGTFYLYNDLESAALTIGEGSAVQPDSLMPLANDAGTSSLLLSTINGEAHTYNLSSFSMADSFSMEADVDLANKEMDRFVTTGGSSVTSGTLTISGLNLISDANSDRAAVYFAESGLMANVTSSVGTAYAPVHEYKIDYVYLDNETITDANGITYSASDSELLSSAESGGYFIFENIGYNSAAMASSFAAMSTFSAMGMMIDYNFEHSDYFMKLPEEVRLAKAEASRAQKSASKIKENDPRRLAYYNQNEMTERGAWFKSFYANESVSYRGGWDSRDKYYGGLVGFDTDLREHGNGWAHLFTGYVGTIGIRQEYSGGHIKQHGGLVGVTGSFYRKNFYTAWTAAAGFTKAHEHTMYGHDTSKNDTWGVAGKFGWNFELAGGKYSILPTFTASYTTVNPEDYTNAADVKFTGSGVRAVQLNPNVKFIMNAENGLQPYVTVGEVWTVGQSSGIKADGEKLPELEMKSYTEYGLGVQKRWTNERDAYVQLLGHSHGRDGILVNAGLRWSF